MRWTGLLCFDAWVGSSQDEVILYKLHNLNPYCFALHVLLCTLIIRRHTQIETP